jgi:hypothetical protein
MDLLADVLNLLNESSVFVSFRLESSFYVVAKGSETSMGP